MNKKLGRGPLGSLRARAKAEVAELFRDNTTIRQARHSLVERLLRAWIVERSLGALLIGYASLLGLSLIAEWLINDRLPCVLPGWTSPELHGFLKDVGSYFITAQVGILAIVTVATGVVTLLSQRDDGASATTDIRLYYSESYAYEVATSGISLLLILTVQLFWPFQYMLHAFGLGGRDVAFKLGLTMAHAAWLAFNFFLFLRFITTTLKFVEPAARAHMRETYSANIAIPRDLETRLLTALFGNAAVQLFGAEELKKGPRITFGYGYTDDDAKTEIELKFKHRVVLTDVCFAPLKFALANWIKRTRKGPRKGATIFDKATWDGDLHFPLTFQTDLEESAILLLRDGDVPLNKWERFVVRHSFRFASPARFKPHPPSPTNFIEDLTDKLISHIERSAITGFKGALDELVRYHRFILAAQNTRDEAGEAFNFAQVGGMMAAPDAMWVRQYRRVYDAAAEKLGVDTEFMEWVNGLATRLFPARAATFAHDVLKRIIELGIFEVIALEAWVTKHTAPGYSPLADSPVRLAGNDQAGYDKVLIAFVGSWETLEQVISISFALRKTGKKTRDANAYPTQWAQLTRSWPSLQTHLQSTAYFFAAAVWNEDETGSERYRDLLLRWLNPFYSFLGHDYEFRNRFLLTPDLMALTWSDVEPFAAALATVLPEERTTPPAVFGLVMRGEHEDVITLCAAISLSWFAREQGATDIGARAGVKILNREVLDEGSDLTASISQPRTVFRSVFDLLLRHTLNPRFGKAKYGETLDGLVQLLAGVASRRMVPGRVYTGWGLEGVESLRPYLLAILAANLPTQADDGVLRAIAEMQAPGGPLSDDDAVRHFIQTFEVLLNTLGATVNEPFARIVRAFNPALNPEECRLALHDLLTSIVTTLQSKQLVRLQNAPLDEAKIQNTRERITKELLAHGPDIHCFRGVVLERGAPSAPIQESRFGVVDRGAFSEPPMSAIEFDEYARIIADESGHRLASDVWRDFFGRAKETIAVATSNGLINFWRAVIANAPRVGPEPTILVPYDDFGEQVAQASHGMTGSGLDAFQVIRVEHFRGGGGIAYMGTIEGVHVFSAEVKPGTATLFSGRSLLGITYGVVHGDEDLADLEFEETENPAESWIRLRFAQTTTWAGTPTLDFHYPVQKEDPT